VDQEPLAGELLRRARKLGRLSQTDVARRAHAAQSVISAYEAGRREPALSNLVRLVAATGHEVVLGLRRLPDARPGLPDSRLDRRLCQHRTAVLSTADRWGADNVRVFGSVARGDDGPGSDVDLLVDLAPDRGLFALGELRRELTSLLGAPVDVVPADSLRATVSDEVLSGAIPL